MALDINKVKQLMKERNMQQKDLSNMVGVTEAAMSRYLSGERQPKSLTLANMAIALKTTTNDLLGLEPLTEADELYLLVARNAKALPQEVKMKMIQLLSTL